ncbi:hypothetical protein EGW08_001403, partial [Elysia chlorotica]
MATEEDSKRCLPKFCGLKSQKKKALKEDYELDGFMSYMQRKEPSSNPALRGDLSLMSTNVKTTDTRAKSKVEGHREERATNIHVIEDIYYNNASRPQKGMWKPYDPMAFKPIRVNMAKGSCSQ